MIKIKDIFLIMFSLMIGAVGGILGYLILSKGNEVLGLMALINRLGNWVIGNIFWFQLSLAVMVFIIVGYQFYKAFLLVKNKAPYLSIEDDEKEDQFEEQLDQHLNIILTLNSTHFILSFILFGLALDPRNIFLMGSVILFILTAFVEQIFSLFLIRMIQKSDPRRKANFHSSKFSKQWFETLDEAEKKQLYKASYKSFEISQSAITLGFLLLIVFKDVLYTGNLPIVILGSIWLTQVLSLIYSSQSS